MQFRNTLLCAFAAALVPGLASAYDEPTVNLGLTSFLDGAPPAGAGWYLTEYLSYYSADHLRDNSGNDLPLPKQDVDVTSSVTQVNYVSNVHLGPTALGVQVLLPWVIDAKTDDGLNGAALKGDEGLGDLEIGPFLQFAPVMGEAGPKFVQRVEFTAILPTGRYDKTAAVTPGSNFFSFDPYWSGTYWFTPKLTSSIRFHYLWNAKNDDPSAGFGPGVSDTQAGQALHANLTMEYAVLPQLRVGVNGYWFQQITNTKVDGESVEGRKEKVWAVGPGAIYSFSKDNHLFFNAYFEQAVRNRPEGDRFVVRYVHHF